MGAINPTATAAKASEPFFGRFRRRLIELELTEPRPPGDPGPVDLLPRYIAAGGTEAQFYEKLVEGADEDDGMYD